ANLAEEHVGRWLKESGVNRRDLVLSTRVVICGDLKDDPSRFEYIRRCFEGSLLRLGVASLDLLLLDWNPTLLPVRSTLNLAEMLTGSDLVSAVGASGFPTWRLMEAHAAAREKGWSPFATAQNDFSPTWPHQYYAELADFCGETGAGFIARPPTTGLHTNIAKARARLAPRRLNGSRGGAGTTWDRLESVAQKRGATVTETSVAWVLAHPLVSSVVVNPSQLDDLEAPIAAVANPMPVDARSYICSGSCPRDKVKKPSAPVLV